APPSLARHEAPVAPASMGRARARRTPPPISPLTIDRIDTPRAPDATDRTNDQARPLPRFTIASTARLTISLSVSPLEAAYVRSRCTRVRESFTVKATLASVTATGAFNRRACRRYRYAWRGDRSQSCTIRSTASGRSSRRDSTWRAWLRRSAFSAAVARPMGHKYTTVSDRVQAPLPVPDDSLKLEVAFCVQAVVSPLLANVYLHYAFDLWARRWRRRTASGDMIVVRYADDIVLGFEHRADAE